MAALKRPLLTEAGPCLLRSRPAHTPSFCCHRNLLQFCTESHVYTTRKLFVLLGL